VHEPAGPLVEVVTAYYFTTAAGPFRDRLYPDWGNIRFALEGEWSVEARNASGPEEPGGTLYGPTDRWSEVRCGGGRGAGLILTPAGWDRLVGTPAHLLANRRAPLGALLGPPGGTVAATLAAEAGPEWDRAGAALFDRLLAERLAHAPPANPRTLAVHRALAGRPDDVAAFGLAAGLSAASLREECTRAFGFNPKRLLRRERLAGTLRRIRAEPSPRPAALRDPTYADQPHFNREFRDFMGTTPRGYLAQPRPLMAEVARAWPGRPFPITAPAD